MRKLIWQLALCCWAGGYVGHLVFEDVMQGSPAWKCVLDTAVAFFAVIVAMAAARALETAK